MPPRAKAALASFAAGTPHLEETTRNRCFLVRNPFRVYTRVMLPTHPTSRRDFLKAGALALGGLTLADVFAGRAVAGQSARETSVILIYLSGGPSHLETYDLKPDAPVAYRSVFEPIKTNVSGIDICELFARQAKLSDKFALVRSLNHDVNIHSDGGIVVLTGKRPTVLDPLSQSKSEHPDFGSVASFCGASRLMPSTWHSVRHVHDATDLRRQQHGRSR